MEAYRLQAERSGKPQSDRGCNALGRNGTRTIEGVVATDVVPTDEEANQHRNEILEMYNTIQGIKVDNIIHSAKIQRTGELHATRAKLLQSKIKVEATKIKSEANSDKKQGIKKLSRAIGEAPAKPLMFVKRDMDTDDGGKKGEITTNPQEVDAIVKRAWKVIYDGVAANMEVAINAFFEQFAHCILHQEEHLAKEVDGDMVYESFRNTADSVGAMDG